MATETLQNSPCLKPRLKGLRLQQACDEIKEILKAVEDDTGCEIEQISVVRIEITNIDSEWPEFIKKVQIELKEPIKDRWS